MLIRLDGKLYNETDFIQELKDRGYHLETEEVLDHKKAKRLENQLQKYASIAPGNKEHPASKKAKEIAVKLGNNITKTEYRAVNGTTNDGFYVITAKQGKLLAN